MSAQTASDILAVFGLVNGQRNESGIFKNFFWYFNGPDLPLGSGDMSWRDFKRIQTILSTLFPGKCIAVLNNGQRNQFVNQSRPFHECVYFLICGDAVYGVDTHLEEDHESSSGDIPLITVTNHNKLAEIIAEASSP